MNYLLRMSCLGVLLLLAACRGQDDPDVIRVGTIAGPETELMQVAKKVAKKRYGLKVKLVTFSDYNMPNIALNDGSINANLFQHLPFLTSQIAARGYKLTAIGAVFIYPMALYSSTLHSLNQLADGARVAIPADPSNEARALLLLQKAGLIRLKADSGINATVSDVAYNPKHLDIIELNAAQLPRSLQDVALAAINTNFAVSAGLSIKRDALFHEGADSPYANVLVVRSQDAKQKRFHQLLDALRSKAVLKKAHALFGDNVVAAFQ